MKNYVPTLKTANIARHEMICEFCPMPVTSVRKDGLQAAYRRHLQAHHPDKYQPVRNPQFRTYPADSTPPPAPVDKPLRYTLGCPYCKTVITARSEAVLPRMLNTHKRNEHRDKLIDEIATRNSTLLAQMEEIELVEVAVAACHYPNRAMRTKYPAPATVRVPARWGVDRVFVHVGKDGAYVAYRGRMGASEGWRVR